MARPSKYDWTNIRLDLEAGQSKAYVHKKYKVPYEAINKHLKRNPLQINQQAIEAIQGFDEVSQVVSQVKETNPNLADRIIDIVKEKHPEFKRAMVGLSAKLLNRMNKLADTASAGEVPQLAKGMQTVTDTLGVSQRHANTPQIAIQNNNTQQIAKIERVIIDPTDKDA